MSERTSSLARYAAPPEVWARVKADYLGGLSAPECCRRHGVGLSALRSRAGREGWRRTDQPWRPPVRAIADAVDGSNDLVASGYPMPLNRMPMDLAALDLDQIEPGRVSRLAHQRMMQAVLDGDAGQALRWRRVAQSMDEDQQAQDAAFDHEEAIASLMAEARALKRREAAGTGAS